MNLYNLPGWKKAILIYALAAILALCVSEPIAAVVAMVLAYLTWWVNTD